MKVYGVCGGNGVLLFPLKKYVKGNLEPRSVFYMGNSKTQWKLNFPKAKMAKDYKMIIGEQVDVMIGCPDCGHSSMMAFSRAKTLGEPKLNKSLNFYIENVRTSRPKIFLFENLPSLFKKFDPVLFSTLFSDYTLVKYVFPVSRWGNSQVSRVRLVIIGIRKDVKGISIADFGLPKKETLYLKLVKELEADLKDPNEALCHVREDDSMIVCMEKDFKKLNLQQVRQIWQKTTRKKWDATTTGKGRMKNLPGVYRNKADEYPLTARPALRQFNSKGYVMSPRELARIQGIPDTFKLDYDHDKKGYTLNKARITVTKTAPYEIGHWFAKKIIKLHKKGLL